MPGLKVLSIVGPGRSGSTLVAQILGEIPGVLDVGELRWLWQRGLGEHRPCGCGQPPSRCPLWSGVVAKTIGDERAASERIADVVAAQRRLAKRSRRIGVIRSAARDAEESPDMARLRSTYAELLDAIAVTTGAQVVVDASKRPIDAAVLAGLPSIDHYVLHLVRDPRAVAFSWGRAKALVGAEGRRSRMARRTASRSAARWLESNLGCELLRRNVASERWLSLRYEDLVAAPETEIDRVCAWLGLPNRPEIHGVVRLRPNHTLAGNPIRFTTGDVPIRVDDEWIRHLGRRRHAVVTSLTLPLLLRYGYSLAVPR